MNRAEILKCLQNILYNEGMICSPINNSMPLNKRTLLIRRGPEITHEINQLFDTDFRTEDILCYSLDKIANIIITRNIVNNSYGSLGNMNRPEVRHLNIVVVGRSGAGKSSFLNYAAGKSVFKTGVGDPVTRAYFEKIDIEKPEKKVIYSLFDTKGLEAGNTDEWKKAIYSEIERRDKSDNIYEWFHTIIFCIDASSKRIQPFEINAIKEISVKGSVLVLLTKKDLVTPEILDSLRNQIKSEVGDKVQILSVCNVTTRTRKGTSNASGLEDVLRVSFLGLWEKASKVLPGRLKHNMLSVDMDTYLKYDLPDLCAFATLVLPEDEKQEKGFISAPILSRVTNEAVNDKNKSEAFLHRIFEKIAELSCTGHSENIVLSISGGYRNRIRIRNTSFLNLIQLPDKLDYGLLNEKYFYSAVQIYIRELKLLFAAQLAKLQERVKTLNKHIGENEIVVKEILQFYNDVNETDRRPLIQHKTKEAIKELEEKDYDSFTSKSNELSSQVISGLEEIGKVFYFNGDERKAAQDKYYKYRAWITTVISEIKSAVDKFIRSYEDELHSYGQYCIRSDEFFDHLDGYTKKKYEQLAELIKTALADNNITSKERAMLELVSKQYGIPTKALDYLIEKYSLQDKDLQQNPT